MIDLPPEMLAEVRRILAQHVPDCQVRVYGSRINGRAQRYSDLDLALVGAGALDPARIEAVREAFSLSDLPFRVDLQDWAGMTPAFRREIEARFEILQSGAMPV